MKRILACMLISLPVAGLALCAEAQERPFSGPFTVLVVLGVAVVIVIALWSGKIRRDGYHKTKTEYPSDPSLNDAEVSNRSRLHRPVP